MPFVALPQPSLYPDLSLLSTLSPALAVMAQIPIPSRPGVFMTVDKELESRFLEHVWHLDKKGYAWTNIRKPGGKRTKMKAHHLPFVGTQYEDRFEQIHHVDNDPLNNQRVNLMPIKKGSSAGRKLQNTIQKKTKSRFGKAPSSKHIGVSWHKGNNKWQALYSNLEGTWTHIGLFDSEEDAASAYQEKVQGVIKALEEIVAMEWEDERV
jgi:hypothetical protein